MICSIGMALPGETEHLLRHHPNGNATGKKLYRNLNQYFLNLVRLQENNMKQIVTGTTGMIGKGVLLEGLDRSDVTDILVVNRRPLGLQHDKLNEVLISDFFTIADVADQLKGYDACLFCLGTSAVGKGEEVYHRITYDLTVLFANTFLQQNPDSAFLYVSGAGTDGSEKGSQMWARVKGKTENHLLQMPLLMKKYQSVLSISRCPIW